MEFTLLYQGHLKSKGTARHKHDLRTVFHSQLKVLWQQKPLNAFHDFLKEDPPKGKISILKKVGLFSFAPLVSEELKLVAEVDISLLLPNAPGSLISQGGDIDNRLKTLLDALRMPKVEAEIPKGQKPKSDEFPFFCVLEDDALITKVSVDTDRLLQEMSGTYVHLLVRVKTKIVEGTWFNISIG
jgi:hypothetical protein